MKKNILQILVLLLILTLSKGGVYADTIDFQIFPAILEIESKPGERIEHQILLRGTGGEQYTLKVYGLNILDEYGRFASSMDEEIALDWISFLPNEFSFELATEKRVKIVIDIPEDVSLGDYYLTVALEKTSEEEGTAAVSGALEIPLLISVMDGALPQMQAKVKEFNGNHFNMFNPIKFKLEIENTGFRKIKSFGKVEIKDLITQKEYVRELVPQNILSQSSRVIMDEYGFYTGDNLISWESKSLFGIYSARADIYDMYFEDVNAQVLTSSEPFYFVYINIYLLGALILLCLIFVIFLLKRKPKALT